MPYGLPSGADLRSRICAATHKPKNNLLGQEIVRWGKVSAPDLQNFGLAFSRSNIASIDAFLARRQEFAEIGKFAIAACLAISENVDALFSDSTTDHWYRLLWNTLIRDASGVTDILQNDVRFVTFNYDRSLECFLHESIKHTFGRDDTKTAEILGKIPILHVYGLAGPFSPVPIPGHREYGAPLSLEGLQQAARSLLLIPEQRDDEVFQKARKWFGRAERICLLGFGFDPLNINRLGLESVLSWKKSQGAKLPLVFATTFGRTKVEVAADRRRLCGDEPWNAFELQNSMMLRETPILVD